MTELRSYIEELNADARAWVAAGPDRWATEFHTDMEAWAESGITTVAEFLDMLEAEHEREMRKASYYDDYYDDVYTTAADATYFDNEDYYNDLPWDYDAEYEEYELRNTLKKYGVETVDMIPTPYEIMANEAGFLEY